MQPLAVPVSAAFFLGMGLLALGRPVAITRFFAVTVLPAEMRNEVRAVYGGYGLTLAILLVVSSEVPSARPGILLTVAASMLGMAVGRSIGFVVDRTVGRWPLVFLGVELVLGGLLLRTWLGGA